MIKPVMSCSIIVVQYMWNIPPLHKFCFFGYPIRKGIAEELPFPNGSVDLLTASSAAHWFDQSRFQAEANRVLKPRGCIALVDFTFANTRLHYKDCGERLTQIFKEVGAWLRNFVWTLCNEVKIGHYRDTDRRQNRLFWINRRERFQRTDGADTLTFSYKNGKKKTWINCKMWMKLKERCTDFNAGENKH